MNIFFLDENIEKNVQYHCDKHVVKMIVEYAQIACTVHHLNGNSSAPYKMTHSKHPCTVWGNTSLENYNLIVELGISLCGEYTFRYNKIHKTSQVFEWLKNNNPPLPSIGITKRALAMPDAYKTDDTVESYRNYYINDKNAIAKWTKRQRPEWMK